MYKRIKKVVICSVLVAIMVFQSVTLYATNTKVNTDEDSSAFAKLEIREGSLDGAVVVDLLNPTTDWKLTSDKDYYLYGEAVKGMGVDHLQITYGKQLEDGTFAYNGLKFFNPPGGIYTPGHIEHDYLDKLTSYTNIDDPKYGPNSLTLPLNDGTMVYHIKESVATNSTFNFAMGLIVDDAIFSGSEIIENAFQVSVGSFDNNVFKTVSSKTSSVNMEKKSALIGVFNSSALSATLNGQGAPITAYIKETSSLNPTALLYNEVNFDIEIPLNAVMGDIGFNTSYTKVSSTLGTITMEKPYIDGDVQKIHVNISSGYKTKLGSLAFYYRVDFNSPDFTDGQTAITTLKNIVITAANNETISVKNPATSLTYTILDANNDSTTMIPVNRTGVYNHTIETSDPYLTNFGLAQINNKSTSSSSPNAKTFEAEYNKTNTAANVSAITIPLGENATTNIVVSGKDANGKTISVTVENPEQYAQNKKISTSTYILLFAKDFGMVTFTSAKAEIGKLRPAYRTSGWASAFDFVNNASGAYGYFTTSEVGIQVKSTYHLYNTDPALRDLPNGDLITSTTATSSGDNRIGFTGDSLTIKNDAGTVIDSISAGNAVNITGNVYPYSVPLAIKEGTKVGTTALVVDPVLYLTLPQGISMESLKLNLTVRDRYAASKVIPISYTTENVSYLNTTNDGVSLYKVRLPKGTRLGYYSDDGSYTNLNLSLRLNTSKSLQTKRYEINSLIGIASESNVESLQYSGNPSQINTIVNDTYNINNGFNYAGITKGSPTTQPGFGLQQLAEINVYNSVSVTKINGSAVNEQWYAYDASDPNSVATLGKNSEGRFKLDIKNSSDVASGQLQVVVPIPKKGLDLGSVFMNGPSQFDMNLSWDNSTLPEGFEAQYIKLDPLNEVSGDFIYENTTSNLANAILLTRKDVPARQEYSIYFDFLMESGNANDINVFRNALRYTTSDNTVNYKTGSYVASAVAGSSITGTVFHDLNRNGIKDPEEVGISDVSVVIKDNENKILSTKTDANGKYEFLAVRESDANINFTVNDESKLRFNVPIGGMTVSNDKLSISKNYSSVSDNETLDVPLSNYYKLSYQANGGVGSLPTIGEYVSGGKATIAVKPDNLLRTGYIFKEWNTQADGKGIGYQPGETIIIENDSVLYAIWELGTYNIYFNYRGATGQNDLSVMQLQHNQSYNFNGALPIPIKTGYDFLGWSNSSAGTTANIFDLTKFSSGEDTTLYALWSPKTGYQVHYNTVGGNAVDSRTVSWTDKVWTDIVPVKEGYEFVGWLYNGVQITNKTTWNELITEDTETELTLQAIWKAKTGFEVEYDLNGGTGNIATKTVSWNEKGLLPSTNPTRNGFAFKGWTYLDQNVLSTTTYESLAKSESIDKIVLKAVWEELSDNTVRYESQGGTMISDKTSVKNSDSHLLPDVDPVKLGYTFNGWTYNDIPVTNETVYQDLSIESVITLTANWIEKEYTIQYNYGNIDSITKKWTETDLIPLNNPTKPGSTFVGWYYGEQKVDSTTKISELIPSDNIDNHIIQLEARWNNLTYTVVYDSDGGTYFSPKSNVIYSANKLLPETNPIKLGYAFTGWYSGETRVTNTTTLGSLLIGQETSVSLKAKWVAKSGFTVHYNTAGGQLIDSKKNITWTDQNLLPESPTRKGYEFVGWICGRTPVTKDTAYSTLATSDATDSSVTLVAQWKVISLTVIYDSQGGTQFANKENVLYEDTHLIPNIHPTKTGYIFDGWYYGNIKVTDETQYSSLTSAESITLKAHWLQLPTIEKNRATVTFKQNGTELIAGKYMYTPQEYTYKTWYNYHMTGKQNIAINGVKGYKEVTQDVDNYNLMLEYEGYYTFILTTSNKVEVTYTVQVTKDDLNYGKPTIEKDGAKVIFKNNSSALSDIKYMYTADQYKYTTWYNFYMTGRQNAQINTSMGYKTVLGKVDGDQSTLDNKNIEFDKAGYYTFLLKYSQNKEIAYTVYIDEERRQLAEPNITNAGPSSLSIDVKDKQTYKLSQGDKTVETYVAQADGQYIFDNLNQDTSYTLNTYMTSQEPIIENNIKVYYTISKDVSVRTLLNKPFIENTQDKVLNGNEAKIKANQTPLIGIIYQYSGDRELNYTSWYGFVNNGKQYTNINGSQGYKTLSGKVSNNLSSLDNSQIFLSKQGWYTFIYRISTGEKTYKEITESIYVSSDYQKPIETSQLLNAIESAEKIRDSKDYSIVDSIQEQTISGTYVTSDNHTKFIQEIENAKQILNISDQTAIDNEVNTLLSAISDYKKSIVTFVPKLVNVVGNSIVIAKKNPDYSISKVVYNVDEHKQLAKSVWASWAGISSEKYLSQTSFDENGELRFENLENGVYTFLISQKEGNKIKEYIQYAIVCEGSNETDVAVLELEKRITEAIDILNKYKKESDAVAGDAYIKDALYQKISDNITSAKKLSIQSDVEKEILPMIIALKQNLSAAGNGFVK